jgi:nickel-dependent lactate racemase
VGSTSVRLPRGVGSRLVARRATPSAPDPLSVVAAALDAPVGAPPLAEAARGAAHVAVVVPDATRPSAADRYLLPLLARLARAGLGPERIRVVVARGLHPASPRADVERIVGAGVMRSLRPVQSAPETPEWNVAIGTDPDVGEVRVHRVVGDAGLVVLTGAVVPHHLAGFSGGAKALVPGVAQRETVLAAHRLTLPTAVAPDGSLRSHAGRLGPNPFRDALVRVARSFGRCWCLNVVLGDDGGIHAAAAGEVGEAHAAVARTWTLAKEPPTPEPHDLVLAGLAAPRDVDLVQAHKGLLAARAWAKPGAPIVWLARAPNGPGHPDLLPWFEIRKIEHHLAAVRQRFHPYGLTAYSLRRTAADHPVHVVSEVSADVLRPMGFLPFRDAQAALDHALASSGAKSVAVLPDALE